MGYLIRMLGAAFQILAISRIVSAEEYPKARLVVPSRTTNIVVVTVSVIAIATTTDELRRISYGIPHRQFIEQIGQGIRIVLYHETTIPSCVVFVFVFVDSATIVVTHFGASGSVVFHKNATGVHFPVVVVVLRKNFGGTTVFDAKRFFIVFAKLFIDTAQILPIQCVFSIDDIYVSPSVAAWTAVVLRKINCLVLLKGFGNIIAIHKF
mmetsp:Transcript_71532/g.145241  ORF Transcript_71532/g.145241 Transcript_71532/m.145241 type:complete len:209 (-) Transcript_71532:317-943(-)